MGSVSLGKSWLICIAATAFTALLIVATLGRTPVDEALIKPVAADGPKKATIKFPEPSPPPLALEKLLGSERKSTRQVAISHLRKRPSLEAALVLLSHAEQEQEGDLVSQSILFAKRMCKDIDSPMASKRLVKLFESSSKLDLRLSVIVAFELYRQDCDAPLYPRMLAVAQPGQERDKIEALIKRKS